MNKNVKSDGLATPNKISKWFRKEPRKDENLIPVIKAPLSMSILKQNTSIATWNTEAN